MENFFDFLTDAQINEILFADLFFLRRRSDIELVDIKKKWINELYKIALPEFNKKHTDVVFFRSLKRDDYKRLFDTIILSSGVNDYLLIETPQLKQGSTNAAAISFLSKNSNIIARINSGNTNIDVCLAVRICFYGFIVSALKQLEFNYLVLFSDMQPIEHLASLFCQTRKIATISTQHALYIEYKHMDTVNVINYKHQPSEYFLAWGENTKKLIQTYHPKSNIVICGKPDIDLINNPPKVENSLIVILDQEIFSTENKKMLSICNEWAKKNKYSIKVKFHPHNNKESYMKDFNSIKEISDIYSGEIIVGHTSSLIFEAMTRGMRVIQFKTNVPTIPLTVGQIFSDGDSFEKALKSTHKAQSQNSIISFFGEKSKECYKLFFDSLLNKKTKKPFFTIIIPSFNSSLTILDCIKTLLSQSFDCFEIIVIDGGSKDQTVQMIQTFYSNDPRVKVYCSFDKGIYDAMNKGIALAKGDWLYFLGSDDSLYEQETLKKVYEKLKSSKSDFAYGSVEVVGDVKWAKNGTIYDGPFDDIKITKKNICHQAIFYRKEKALQVGFYDLKYKLCADWDMNLRFWGCSEKIYLDLTVAKFFSGGASTSGGDPEFGKDFKKKIEILSQSLNKGSQAC